ncbi:AAA family ATPase [Rhizobium oryzicola]|uniref:AAA family ATPase n=1 Tax=Rhizobium oryzicola TaxID=1232668 RepID=A0ABT8SUN4_9HYPH|nr:AAA family ATPase [Rhizobium oryzicola]MDO1582152.1 AAA family ATPase [Rhizobium oryzicola]
MPRMIIISGCSGGGKSTILAELKSRGFSTIEEPGRRIVAEELASGGTALPWVDLEAFARRAIDMALKDMAAAQHLPDPVFFDRSAIDAASALTAITGDKRFLQAMKDQHRYHRRVFMAPPWPEIYVTDPERRHGISEAIAEYDRLQRDYSALDYEVIQLPKLAVSHRVRFLLNEIEQVAEDLPD